MAGKFACIVGLWRGHRVHVGWMKHVSERATCMAYFFFSEMLLLNLHVISVIYHKMERSQIIMELQSTKRKYFYYFLLNYSFMPPFVPQRNIALNFSMLADRLWSRPQELLIFLGLLQLFELLKGTSF